MPSVPQRPRMGATRLLRTLFASLLATAVLASALPATLAHAEDEVSIPDAALKSCIGAALVTKGLPNDFTASNLAQLTSLTCDEKQSIVDLTGLDSLAKLTRVSFYNLADTNLQPLAALTGLVSVGITSVGLTDLGQLSSLTKLWSLRLETPKVTDLSFVAGFQDLDSVGLQVADTADLRVLGGLPRVVRVNMTSSGPNNLAAIGLFKHATLLDLKTDGTDLAGLTLPGELDRVQIQGDHLTSISDMPANGSITNLNLVAAGLTDLTGIGRLSHLQTLHVAARGLRDLTPLGLNEELTTLSVSQAQVSDLSPLRSLTKLKGLYVSINRITDLSPLAGLGLTGLDVSSNAITSLAPLAGMPLTSLNLDNNQISSLAALAGMPLTRLTLRLNKVTNLTGLAGLPLTQLTMPYNQVSDLTPLHGAPLTTLNVAGNHVGSLAPLAGMPLTELNASGNQVTSLAPLAGMPLTQLDASGNQISSLAPLAGMPLTQLHFSSNQISSLAPLAGMHLTTLSMATNKISDLAPIAGMPITSLAAADNQISTVSSLAQLPDGATVNLSGNRLRDFSPLPDSVKLTADRQTLPSYPEATKGKPFDFGLRAADGQALCPKFTPAAPCTNGLVTYPEYGLYSVWLPSPFHTALNPASSADFTQYAGPVHAFKTQRPSLKGVGLQVGRPVKVKLPVWTPRPSNWLVSWSYDYQIFTSTNVTDADSVTFKPRGVDAGHRLKLCVWGFRDGLPSIDMCSSLSEKVKQGVFVGRPSPQIAGEARSGGILTANAGRWDSAAHLKFQWQRDGKSIKGATKATYRPKKSDRGHRIRVRITATARGYRTEVRHSISQRIR